MYFKFTCGRLNSFLDYNNIKTNTVDDVKNRINNINSNYLYDFFYTMSDFKAKYIVEEFDFINNFKFLGLNIFYINSNTSGKDFSFYLTISINPTIFLKFEQTCEKIIVKELKTFQKKNLTGKKSDSSIIVQNEEKNYLQILDSYENIAEKISFYLENVLMNEIKFCEFEKSEMNFLKHTIKYCANLISKKNLFLALILNNNFLKSFFEFYFLMYFSLSLF